MEFIRYAIMWIASEWDIALTVGLFVLGGTMSITAWLFKKRMEAYDKHLEECNLRAVATGRMDERLIGVEHQINGIDIKVNWVGDCMLTMGAKFDFQLPDRPQ